MIFDADGAIIGRLGTRTAKALLGGESVAVVNAERAVITGGRAQIIAKYKARRAVISKANPEHAPHWPRRPDMLVRRILRGMLPFGKARGREAFHRLRVYMGVPEEFKGKESTFERTKSIKDTRGKFITISELSSELGWQI